MLKKFLFYPVKEGKMQYRILGKSGLKISEIGLGGTNFGEKIGEPESIAVIRYALDSGVNFIDTANRYGDGRSEEFIGKAIKGRRDEVIISTKFGLPMFDLPNDGGGSRQNIIAAVEASLKRLNTDYVDLYYIHWPDETTPIEETLRTLDTLVKSGKVRYIGCCNFNGWQLCEAIWTSRVNLLESFTVVQLKYNILDRSIEPEVVPFCQKYGLGVIPWSPLAGGFLTGKYQKGAEMPRPGRPPAGTPPGEKGAGKKIAPLPPMPSWFKMVPTFTDTNFEKVEKMKKYAAGHGHTVEELSLAWLLAHRYINSIIAGARTNEQVVSHVKAAEWKLTAEEMSEIEELVADAPVGFGGPGFPPGPPAGR